MAKKLRELVVAVSADTGAYHREMNRMSRMNGDYFQSIEGGAKRADAAFNKNTAAIRQQSQAVNGAMESVAAYTRAIAGTFAAGKIIQLADSWGQISSRLRIATDNQDEFSAAQSRLMDMSNRVYKDFGQSAELFIRTNDSLKQLGYTSGDTLGLVEALSYGLTVSAADSQKAGSAVDALSKAILTGKLSMDGYETVVAAAPRLQKALADALGVTNAGLREMVAAGKVGTIELMRLSTQIGIMGKEADAMPVTLTDSFTRLGNQLLKYVGQTNEAYGATVFLTDGVNLLSDNIGVLAEIGGAAAIGALAGKFLQIGKEAATSAKGVLEQTASLRANAAAQVLAAETAARRAVADTRTALMAQATANATVRGADMSAKAIAALADKQAVATAAVVRARATEVMATNAVTAAQARYNAVSSAGAMVTRGLSGALSLMGGPAGLAVTVATVAAGWLLFRDNTDEASRSLRDMTGPLDEVVKKYGELNAIQKERARTEKLGQITSAQDDMLSSVNRLTGVALSAAGQSTLGAYEQFKAGVNAVNADISLSTSQASEKVLALIDAYVRVAPSGKGYRDTLMDIASTYLNSRDSADRYSKQLKAMEGSQDAVASSASAMGAALGSVSDGMASSDWSKYLRSLESARDIIGLTAQQMGQYKATAEGANLAQATLAGALVAQTDAAQTLQRATADKDAKAAQGAKETLASLVAVEAQQRAIIAGAQEAARLQTMMASGGITAEGFGQMVAAAFSSAYDTAIVEGTARTNAQIQSILGNTSVKTPKSGASKAESWDKWRKERQIEIDGQRELIAAYEQGQSAVEKATLAKQIEGEVLKQGTKHREEVVRLLTEEARLALEVDASKRLADYREEIGLTGAKTEAEKMLWQTQVGRYAALSEASKAALVASAAELDTSKKAAEQIAYIGEVTGRGKADETLERMGWLADAFDRGAISAEQMQLAVRELTGQGLDDLTEFAVQGARNIQSGLGDQVYNALTGRNTDTVAAFRDLLARMAAEYMSSQFLKLMMGDFGSGGNNKMGGLLGSLGKALKVGSLFTGGAGGIAAASGAGVGGAMTQGLGGLSGSWGALASANGNVFSAGSLMPFAKGGAFTNGLVDSPVTFPLGIMGEAGPEAIMPLSRGADGSLGVRAQFSGAERVGKDLAPQMPRIVVNNMGTPQRYDVESISRDEVRLLARDEFRKEGPRMMAREQRNPNSAFSKEQGRSTKTTRNR